MHEYNMFRIEMVNEILLGVAELRYYKVNINNDYGRPSYLNLLSDMDLERIYNQISDKLKEVKVAYK